MMQLLMSIIFQVCFIFFKKGIYIILDLFAQQANNIDWSILQDWVTVPTLIRDNVLTDLSFSNRMITVQNSKYYCLIVLQSIISETICEIPLLCRHLCCFSTLEYILV